MRLHAGARLGPYEITAPIGAGGMGEVYAANDHRLSRRVAIKVLAERLLTDADALSRFEREARAIGSVSHPNLVIVHDVGAEESVRYVVMELLEGETLRARLNAAGPAGLPVRKALEIAIQIADGLAAAHAKGIAHRDLKSENIFLTAGGRVKILDFGLARLSAAHAASGDTQTDVRAHTSQTAPGVVLGTAGYLAPEQIRGKPADHRADLFAFGAVLFEMLSGARAFSGGSGVEMMNAILTADPFDRLPAHVQWPLPLDNLVRHCLEKEPEERFQSARDLSFQLHSILSGSGATTAAATASPRRRSRWVLGSAAVAILLLGVALGWAGSRVRPSADASGVPVTFSLAPPDGVSVWRYSSIARAGLFAVSPDGRRIVFVGRRADDSSQLFVRDLDSLEVKSIEGTTGANYPFWSPDSTRVAFCSAGKLRWTTAEGGPVAVIADCPNPRTSGAWGGDDTILFAPTFDLALVRVSASGGPTTALDLSPTPRPAIFSPPRPAFFSPAWLDARRFLVVGFPFDDGAGATAGVYVGQVDSSALTEVLRGRVSEAAVDRGELIIRRGEELIAQPFDRATGRLHGSPRTLAQRVIAMSAAGGTLVYHAPPQGASLGSRITWFSRAGVKLHETGNPTSVNDLRLSPDGRFLAATRPGEFGLSNIWLYDLKRNVDQQVSNGGTIVPAWSFDSRYVIGLGADGVRRFDLSALGSPPQLIVPSTGADIAADWSADGKYVVLRATGASPPLEAYPVQSAEQGQGNSLPIARRGLFAAFRPPDGKWIAYSSSDHSGGTPRVYVSAFPPRGDRVPVSSVDASHMRWRRDGRELFVLTNGAPTVLAVDVTETGNGLEFGPPRKLFTLPRILRGSSAFDVSPDGQRFVFIIPGDLDRTPLIVLRNRAASR
jgi:Tol biopolymer transport system component/tRNA A-37 threonylcarbamoyl transferase component Bud32